MRLRFVAVALPASDFNSGVCQARPPTPAERFVAEAPVESRTQSANSGALRRETLLNQHVFDLVHLCPHQKGWRSELGFVVDSDGFRATSKLRRLVEQARDVARSHADAHVEPRDNKQTA